jgi:hypothetical protein
MYVILYRMFYELWTLLPEMISCVFMIKNIPINMDCIYEAMCVFIIPLNALLGKSRRTSWFPLHNTGLWKKNTLIRGCRKHITGSSLTVPRRLFANERRAVLRFRVRLPKNSLSTVQRQLKGISWSSVTFRL